MEENGMVESTQEWTIPFLEGGKSGNTVAHAQSPFSEVSLSERRVSNSKRLSIPRYKSRRKGGVLRSGLSGWSQKKKERRLKNLQSPNVQSYSNEHSFDTGLNNGGEQILSAVEGLLMLKTSEDEPQNLVWANQNSSPFIVSPLRTAPVSTPILSHLGSASGTPKRGPALQRSMVSLDPSPPKRKFRQRLLFAESDNGTDPLVTITKDATTTLKASIYTQTEINDILSPDLRYSTATPLDAPTNIAEADTENNSSSILSRTDISPNITADATTSGVSLSEQTTPLLDSTHNHRGGTIHWRYESFRGMERKEFHRLTGLNQENFEVLYKFLGGDTVCDKLKYVYGARTPRRKKFGFPSVKSNIRKNSAKTYLPTWKDSSRLSSKDKLFMTLIRLRRGHALADLALMFGISKTQVSTILFVWVQFLYLQFGRIRRNMCVTRHDQPSWKIAPCYRRYKNFRMVLDTTEIRIQTPRHYRQQGNTYSSYKAGNVILYMIGTTGWGSISFVSPGFEGSMSDRQILRESTLMDYLEPGDLILVDRGFKVKDLMGEIGVTVVHPPFTKKKKPLCPEDLMLTKRVASDRIHVERAIRKVKCFNLLRRITNRMLPILDQLVFICSCLVNFDANNVR